MNRRIPPDELPWFKRNPTEVIPSGQLLYGCPVLLGNTSTLYSPVTFLFPYISRVWSVYQPRILVVDAYPSKSGLFHIAQSGNVDVYETNENPATSSMVIDVAHHYDLILSNYILVQDDDRHILETLEKRRCMLFQWSFSALDISVECAIEGLMAAIKYSGFCRRRTYVESIYNGREEFFRRDLQMFYNL